MNKPKNMTELVDNLTDNYAKMYDKKLPLNLGKELSNTAGKIMNGCKIQFEYNNKMGYKHKIDFLEVK